MVTDAEGDAITFGTTAGTPGYFAGTSFGVKVAENGTSNADVGTKTVGFYASDGNQSTI